MAPPPISRCWPSEVENREGGVSYTALPSSVSEEAAAARRSSMSELTERTAEADKVLVF
jgi:hypothetical protein